MKTKLEIFELYKKGVQVLKPKLDKKAGNWHIEKATHDGRWVLFGLGHAYPTKVAADKYIKTLSTQLNSNYANID